MNILFVCTGNTGRSMTAEALARAQITAQGLDVTVFSRGVRVDPASRNAEAPAAALLATRGIDVRAHRATALTPDDIRKADLILTATDAHRRAVLAAHPAAAGKTWRLAEYAAGEGADIPDAFAQSPAVYAAMVEAVARYVHLVLAKLAPRAYPAAQEGQSA